MLQLKLHFAAVIVGEPVGETPERIEIRRQMQVQVRYAIDAFLLTFLSSELVG